jgi:hypothetical protein
MIRYRYLLAFVLLAMPAAFAQAPGGPPAPQGVPHGPGTFRMRFEAANTTHDGRLTLDQAQAANMRGVVQHFTAMDADKKGYVTLQDVRAWHAAQRAARMAPQGAPQPQ